MKRKNGGTRADTKQFVQVTQTPNLGVEVSTGRAWIGVDQQVGHGSADALFALTDEQYAGALVGNMADWQFTAECWRGEHDDLRLFRPGGGSWVPERWSPCRTRMMPPPFAGEIWWHIDALGEPVDSQRVEIARSLAADSALIATGPDGVNKVTFRLVGDGAYPRPAALIAGLTAGSDREQARAILGDPVDATVDEFVVEGARLRLGYVGDALTEFVLERPNTLPQPDGQIGVFLAALGEPEEGPAFQAAARLAGDKRRRWADWLGGRRRLLAFAGGVDMQLEDDRVLSVRINLMRTSGGSTYRHARNLIPGAAWPLSREGVRRVLGAPVASNSGADLHRYGHRDLLVEYGVGVENETPVAATAVISGVTVWHSFRRWRSGEFTLFMDILGREQTNPLVASVRGLEGVKLRMRGGIVSDIEIGTGGHQTERFSAFVDGMPGEPTRKDFPFGTPTYFGEWDYVWDREPGVVHVRTSDGDRIISISISQDLPRGIKLKPWMLFRDTWPHTPR